jgi:hypothetical protein
VFGVGLIDNHQRSGAGGWKEKLTLSTDDLRVLEELGNKAVGAWENLELKMQWDVEWCDKIAGTLLSCIGIWIPLQEYVMFQTAHASTASAGEWRQAYR